ncbi:chromosomal replication initiator protein DnaA [Thiotrichales bacterium 19S3-7]|nr:chromosomal replication initiator protein DnaA [Thiotrichales bacterium 19S3-7]MCF6801653.1 chromosomal replication initiator protein DnaA [Thiotrichales bacterium 19S3-11]
MVSAWKSTLEKLKNTLRDQEFRTWIEPLKIMQEDKLFTIYVPNNFFLDWINRYYRKQIVDIFNQQTETDSCHVAFKVGQPDKIILVNDTQFTSQITPKVSETASEKQSVYDNLQQSKDHLKSTTGAQLEIFSDPAEEARSLDQPREIDNYRSVKPSNYDKQVVTETVVESKKSDQNIAQPYGMLLKPLYTFDNFVEGKSNEVAKAAAIHVTVNPGAQYNPLFIYGGSGLGKTHLMHAIGNKIRQSHPHMRILYVSSERFVRDFVDALRLQAMEQFQDCYRSVDVLLVDDIQFIAGKGRSQEEFFHTFNVLLDNGKQIVLSCDRYPKEIEGIEDRLRSRFGHGLTCTIDLPDLETRGAILMHKARQFGIEISHEIAFFIANNIRSNVRELEGALNRVLTFSRFERKPITVKYVKEILQDIISVQERLVKVDNIQKVVADFYGIKVQDLLSKQKSRDIARPRQIAMALAKELTSHSLPEIGNFFGGRDHTTVLHAVRTIEKLRQSNIDIREDYQTLSRKLAS